MDHAAVMDEREVTGLVVARVGRVEATSATALPWVVLDGAGRAITPATEFLRELLACGNTAASCRSYAFDLLRWFRFLAAVDVEWSHAKRVDVRDFVLWLRTCHNPARDRRRLDAPAPGSLNARTGKPYLKSGYAPATINHAVSVLAAFYDHHLQTGQGPLVSPVPPQSRDGRRLEAHHNPLEPFRLHGRGEKQVDREPRAVPDDVVEDLFTSQTKGLGGAKEACPASPEAFAWLALYLGELAQDGHRPAPDEPVWWTLRGQTRPLTYTALRAVLNRIAEVHTARLPPNLLNGNSQRRPANPHRREAPWPSRSQHHSGLRRPSGIASDRRESAGRELRSMGWRTPTLLRTNGLSRHVARQIPPDA